MKMKNKFCCCTPILKSDQKKKKKKKMKNKLRKSKSAELSVIVLPGNPFCPPTSCAPATRFNDIRTDTTVDRILGKGNKFSQSPMRTKIKKGELAKN